MTPRAWLETSVDSEHAEEILKHRQRLRKPLTDYAAKLLARKLAQCPDANAAADMMIEKGWQSIEPEWLQPKQGYGRAPRQTMVGVLDGLISEMEKANDVQCAQGSFGFAPNAGYLAAPKR